MKHVQFSSRSFWHSKHARHAACHSRSGDTRRRYSSSIGFLQPKQCFGTSLSTWFTSARERGRIRACGNVSAGPGLFTHCSYSGLQWDATEMTHTPGDGRLQKNTTFGVSRLIGSVHAHRILRVHINLQDSIFTTPQANYCCIYQQKYICTVVPCTRRRMVVYTDES